MFDLIVRGGLLVDGSGEPGYKGDIAVKDGRIVAVGQVHGEARQVVEAEGRWWRRVSSIRTPISTFNFCGMAQRVRRWSTGSPASFLATARCRSRRSRQRIDLR